LIFSSIDLIIYKKRILPESRMRFFMFCAAVADDQIPFNTDLFRLA